MHAHVETRTLARPDGRRLAWCEYGTPDGVPVFYLHGFPGSRLEVALVGGATALAGLRVIAIDRPGFGRSDEQPKRTLLDWPADVAFVADALGIERFSCLGVSGGGPYALACAHALASRLDGVTVACGLGPLHDRSDAGRLARAGMIRANRILFALAGGPEWPVRALAWPFVRALRFDPGRASRRLFASLPLADRAALVAPGRLAALVASAVESLRQGTRPFAQEAALYVRPWGFRLEDVHAEVRLYQGELDVNVPVGMARYQEARLPHCRGHYYAEDGHYSLVLNHLDEILGSVHARG